MGYLLRTLLRRVFSSKLRWIPLYVKKTDFSDFTVLQISYHSPPPGKSEIFSWILHSVMDAAVALILLFSFLFLSLELYALSYFHWRSLALGVSFAPFFLLLCLPPPVHLTQYLCHFCLLTYLNSVLKELSFQKTW